MQEAWSERRHTHLEMNSGHMVLGVHTVSLNASHTPQISQSEAVAKVVLEAVAAQQ